MTDKQFDLMYLIYYAVISGVIAGTIISIIFDAQIDKILIMLENLVQ